MVFSDGLCILRTTTTEKLAISVDFFVNDEKMEK